MLNHQLKDVEEKRKELKKKYRRMLITKREAALELCCSTSTIDRMRRENLLRSIRVRGRVMIALDEIAHVTVFGA